MKIGILTFTNTSNYGASLQAFALQQAFICRGHECEIIDYINEKVKEAHDPRAVLKRHGIKKLYAPVVYYIFKKRLDRFREFEEAHCIFSKEYTREMIPKIAAEYDRIVVGSDQVWNPDITGGDKTFFLDFLQDNRKKYSYAASLGTGYFSVDKENYECLLKHFCFLSVREQDTAKELRRRIGRDDVSCDLDPTFLIHDQWKDFVRPENPDGDYIFMYLTPEDTKLLQAVRTFAKKEHCKVILLKKGASQRRGIKVVNIASPIDFINYIAHAKYVIAGSFHALCFSIMFGKRFFTTAAVKKNRTGRLISLLDTLGLRSRMVSSPDYLFNDSEIDYDSVNELLEEKVSESRNTIDFICRE